MSFCLLKQLRKLSKALTQNVSYCNYGGCGVIAGEVGKALQGYGVMVEVVTPVGAYYGKSAIDVRSRVRNINDAEEWSVNGLDRTHLAVRFRYKGKTYTWDSDGLMQSVSRFGEDRYTTSRKFGDGLTVTEVIKMSSKRSGWNSSFDRKQIPLVKHLVKHYLLFEFKGLS